MPEARDDNAERAEREAQARAELSAEAHYVMHNSQPTPTQREVDLIKTGELHPDAKQDPMNPEMPPVHEQRARVAHAGGPAPYRTRQLEAAEPAAQPADDAKPKK